MVKTYTTETRIVLNQDITSYLNDYVIAYNKLYHKVWTDITSDDFEMKYPKFSTYISHICTSSDILKRTANTIYRSAKGRLAALKELKKDELNNINNKIKALYSEISAIKKNINKLKPSVTKNKAKEKQLCKYRRLKQKLYQKQRKYNRYIQRKNVLNDAVQNEKYSLIFGGKRLLKAQYHLEENGYKNREQWLKDYRAKRNKNIEYLGSKDETQGNQMCQMTYDPTSDKFNIQLRKEKSYADKYLIIKDVDFKYMKEHLKRICIEHQEGNHNSPLTFRFKKDGAKWYLQVMFDIECIKYVTRNSFGTIGLDFNDGFIELSETDAKGNLINQKHYGLRHHGCGNKAKSEMGETVSRIVTYAVQTGKDITIEELNFKKKKARVNADKKNKKYNRMIHQLDYSRYGAMLNNACHRKGVVLKEVNPCYTSIVGEKKYGYLKKLNRHQAASYIIARLGQGYTDIYGKYKTRVS